MINDINDLLLAIETYLQNYTGLSYVETAEINMYHPENLPNFNTHAILISPAFEEEKNIANRTKLETDHLKVVCIVRNFDPRLSVIGTAPGQYGIIKLVKDTKKALMDFGKEKKKELTILLNETNKPVGYDTHPFPDRKKFFHEVIIPYMVKLKPITIEV